MQAPSLAPDEASDVRAQVLRNVLQVLPSAAAAGEMQLKVSTEVEVFSMSPSMSPSPTVAQIRALVFMLLPIPFIIHYGFVVHKLL